VTVLDGRSGEGIPKYFQIARILREKIQSQEYAPGGQIPTEVELCETYQVSRITVREAINKLVQEGWLDRRQGKGTYVVHQKLRRNIAKVYSFSSDMRQLGLEPRSRILDLRVEEASPEIVRKMKLPETNHRVTRITRVRIANDVPILVETAMIPEYLCAGLADHDLAGGSLYRILTEEYRLMPHHAEETYEAIILSREDAVVLERDPKVPHPAFAIQRMTFLADGVPMEFGTSVGRGDLLTLAINMVADKADFQRVIDVEQAGQAEQRQ
jgi:GntR family transcriptional regulator